MPGATPSLRAAIASLLRDPEDVVLARDILGSVDVDEIAAQVEAFVPGLTGCALFTQSVGAVFVLERAGGERVVLKVHAFGPGQRTFETLGELEQVYAAQDALAAQGMPCARVLAAPRAYSVGRAAALMSYLTPPARDDPHAPTTADAMARELARLMTMLAGSTLPDRSVLPRSLFPPAHNALFDLDLAGGDWIDRRAAAARAVLETGVTRVAIHSDFSCANVIVAGGQVRAIFDCDSLCIADELRVLASAAVHYTYNGEAPWTWPSRDQARAFVAVYEAARGRPFERAERARLSAAAIYAMAYTARCEYGHAGAAGMCEALAAAPDDYFG
jgi:hypothetical protein